MKKVMFIGELNLLLASLNQHLSAKFQTQMCPDNYELVRKMVKVFKLDMAVICLNSDEELDNRIMEYFADRNVRIPVLLIGTSEECEKYHTYYEHPKFDCVARPTTLGVLQRKCEEMLKLAEADEKPQETEKPEEKKKGILAVDDSGILLRSVKSMLEEQYEVTVANSGIVALKQAKKKLPDLILLDYEMPEWDGKRTLEEIRNDEELKDVPVVFLTAVADKAHIGAVLNLKPSGYLLKPIEKNLLLDTIEKALIKI